MIYTTPSETLLSEEMRKHLCRASFTSSNKQTVVLGSNENGNVLLDLNKGSGHLLIAGSSGSGKSVMIHAVIISLIMKNATDTARFIFIDPKIVEFSAYNNSPMLLRPVCTEPAEVPDILDNVLHRIKKRYAMLQEKGLRNINGADIPHIYIVIDELADMMLSDQGKTIKNQLIRIAQIGRAAGVHLIVATQQPTVKVVPGLLKANITNRVALRTASASDSRVILDHNGAEKIMHAGDAIIKYGDKLEEISFHGCYADDACIERIAHGYTISREKEGGILSALFRKRK